MRILTCLSLVLSAALVPAHGAETAWQELAPGVNIRLISAGATDADGTGLFALEIDMPEDTRTYWRVPGETGLPTELSFSGSQGLAHHEQLWPLPAREVISGYTDYVYAGHTILPIRVDVESATGQVQLDATLGICSDICVPAQASLSLPASDSHPDPANALRIRQALADVPIAWEDGPEPIGAIELAPDGQAVLVEVDQAIVDPDSLILAGDLDDPLFGAPQKSPQADLVLLPIIGKTDNSDLDGMTVELSFMTSMGAYAVSRTIEVGADGAVDVIGQ